MKRLSLAIILTCCTLMLAAQDVIQVKYKGAKPTITDFAWAFVTAEVEDEEECGDHPENAIEQALAKYRQGLPQEEGVTFVVDEKNGFISFEEREENDANNIFRLEMCYWNEADGKHKLFAFNNMASIFGNEPLLTETSGITFYRYNNTAKKMTYCAPPGFDVEYDKTSYALPRTGKDIVVTKWGENGKKTQKTLKWNGRRFSK